jgi:hypothetical protein
MPELCIHGHFYQPPRIDPWLEEILPEGAAAPFLNWNERIASECYGPLAHARRLNSRGELFDILNCYEWISFNFGPTLFHWMQRHSPALHARVIGADRRSLARLGHGNALAQCYHHAILPLSGELDRELEVQWSVKDFEYRFGRPPEGIWLPETAVDTPTLETLASAGIRFTILAPRQAQAVAGLDDDRWQAVDEHGLDTSRPYLARLPSGRSIALFFYDGPVSRAVAFEGLLSDGEAFWQRLTASASGFHCIATDGESYGHHFKFGEMALAYLIDQARSGRDGWELTNFGAALASTPPQLQVRIRERSSWSCIHGVGRWNEDCGCTDGGHPGWHQKWRAPLRRAFDILGQAVDRHLQSSGRLYFPDTRTALVEFGRMLSGELSRKEFLGLHCNPAMTTAQQDKAFALLSTKRWALASLSSCAWFFDDIGRLEPLNGMTFALRSMELLRAADGPDIAPQFAAELENAASNVPSKVNGAKLWREVVLGRRSSPEDLVCLALALDEAGGAASVPRTWPGVRVSIQAVHDSDRRTGTAVLGFPLFSDRRVKFDFTRAADLLDSTVLFPGRIELSPRVLEPRKQRLLAAELTLKQNDHIWQAMVEAARQSSPLFLPFEEGQAEPIGQYHPLSPGLGWLWIIGKIPDSRDLQDFLSRTVRRDQVYARLISRRVTLFLLELMGSPPVDWALAARVIIRSRFLGFEPERWEIQNRMWEIGREALSTEAARLINFAK